MKEHRVTDVYPGQIKGVYNWICSCGHRGVGSGERQARENGNAHVQRKLKKMKTSAT